MKKSQLQQIIKEEIQKVISEYEVRSFDMRKAANLTDVSPIDDAFITEFLPETAATIPQATSTAEDIEGQSVSAHSMVHYVRDNATNKVYYIGSTQYYTMKMRGLTQRESVQRLYIDAIQRVLRKRIPTRLEGTNGDWRLVLSAAMQNGPGVLSLENRLNDFFDSRGMESLRVQNGISYGNKITFDVIEPNLDMLARAVHSNDVNIALIVIREMPEGIKSAYDIPNASVNTPGQYTFVDAPTFLKELKAKDQSKQLEILKKVS